MNYRNYKKFNKSHFIIVFFLIIISFFFLSNSVGQIHAQKKFSVTSHDNTNFPLTGRHRTTQCSECHLKGVLKNTPTSCEHCHWTRKQDDRYRLQIGYNCGDCHTTFSWKKIKPNSWSHMEKTGFLLEGIHKTLDCFNCHKKNVLIMQQSDCIDCHRKDYEEESDPDHKKNLFPFDCKSCHKSMVTWDIATYPHDRFPLVGTHKTLDCSECHKDGNYQGNSSECISCHLNDYNEVKDPDHINAGFPVDCAACHKSMTTWEGALFGHTNPPLEGAHKILDCVECHKNGIYAGLSFVCTSCHLQDYNNTQNPNHKNAGYSTNCEQCHLNTHIKWTQATTNHQFPLTSSAHRNMSCTQCHKNGIYTGLSSRCESCHTQDYNNTQNPNHQNAGYSTDCESCHFITHISWNQAVFNHQFPITSGDHKNISCSECHISAVYQDFSCIDCHEHQKGDMDDEHKDESGYSYNSKACYSCHPDGKD